MIKIGFIGAGNMAKAIINSMINNTYSVNDIVIFDIDSQKCSAIHKNLNIQNSAKEVIKKSNIIFLAIKPQNYQEVLSEIKSAVAKDKIFVSIAAGISTEYVKKQLYSSCEVIRVMPNTPLLLGKGATAIAENNKVSAETFKIVKNIFEMSSTVEIIDESKMNEIIAVNGSSPAYIYLFAKAVVDYAVSVGIDADVALNLICQTLVGSADMMKNSGCTPEELIKMVSSPGGTTISALNKLEEFKFYDAIKAAMASCTNRAEELGC